MGCLPFEYFQNPDVLFLSQNLLGKFLFTKIDNVLTGGVIVETEAYKGPEDRASHAHNNRRTKRNEMMYAQGGTCYVYRCYGIHSLFNVVTNEKDIPHAVLIRALQPIRGIDEMLKRRGKPSLDRSIAGGPGLLSQALGIATKHNGTLLTGQLIWIEDLNIEVPKGKIISTQRVGVSYAGEDAKLPWRYRIADNLWTSPAS